MTNTYIKQTLAFKRAYKKLRAKEKLKVNDAIQTIIHSPQMGQKKKGDLVDIFVYKFKIQKNQDMLLAYRWGSEKIFLIALGVHENFYRELKNIIKI